MIYSSKIIGDQKLVLLRLYMPIYLFQCCALVFNALLRRYRNRYVRDRLSYYPRIIKEKYSELPKNIPNNNFEYCPTPVDGPRRLKVAVGWYSFNYLPDWHFDFKEHEQYVSIHRWNWLLRSITDEQYPPDFSWGCNLARSWISKMKPIPEGDAGESYSIAERISNICLYSRHLNHGWFFLPNDIKDFVTLSAVTLSGRVEYHDRELSGNHVINNARALLFAGHCVRIPELVDFARSLIAERLPKLVISGFLREGSSHYQLLFTRWLFEIAMLAEENDDFETQDLIKPYLCDMLIACDFFMIDSENKRRFFPTIGDVSPDAEPSWLHNFLNSSLVSDGYSGERDGWAKLFPDSTPLLKAKRYSDSECWSPYPQSGWYRLNYKGWIAIWHVESPYDPLIASHAHHDVCSLVLYKNGEEVLIDIGRFEYGKSRLSNYGVSANGHNSITLNGISPLLSRGDRFLPRVYKKSECSIEYKWRNDCVVVSIKHNGFSRLNKHIKMHTRNFYFKEDRVEIEDMIEGTGAYDFDSRFHLPCSENILQTDSCIDKSDKMFSVKLDHSCEYQHFSQQCVVASSDTFDGWRFPAYGIREPARTFSYTGSIDLPFKIKYVVSATGI